MPLRSLERRFARYRRTGDPAALAAVFDATAAEILRVAHHLTRDASAAEDLLQRTFVTAIESAATWDPTRRLTPWLLGILGNHAKEAARLAARVIDPERRPATDVASPAAAAADREALANVDRELDALPDPARSILVLRFRHGLEPAEIALALGMPPATVRSHLHRGVERVRRAVPGALGVGALCELPTRGLEAVRAAVLERAGDVSPALVSVAPAVSAVAAGAAVSPSTGALILGGTLMGKKTIVVATGLALLVGGGVWVAVQGSKEWTRSVSAPRRLADGVSDVVTDARSTLAAGQGRGVAAEPLGAGSPPGGAAADPAKGALDVELVSSASQPLSDEPIFLVEGERADPTAPRRSARTGPDGRVRVEGLSAGKVLVRTGRGGGTHADVPSDGVGAVRVTLARGVRIEGVVVDAEDSPVAGAELWVDSRDILGPAFVQVGVADAKGRFEIVDLASHALVSARVRGRTPSGTRSVAGAAGQVDRMRLVIGGAGAIVRGRVVGADGVPVAGAVVFVGDALLWQTILPDGGMGGGPAGIPAWTAADGSFEIDSVALTPTTLTVRARGHAPHRQPFAPVAGVNIVALGLGRPYAIEGRVVTADGSPAAGARIRSQGHHDVMWSWSAVADAEGRFRLEDLPSEEPGGWALSMVIHHASGQESFTARAPWPQGESYRLRGRVSLRVRAEDEGGRPLVGRVVIAGPRSYPGGATHSTTDAEGRAALDMDAQDEYMVGLRAPGDEESRAVVERVYVRSDANEIVLVERRTARTSARLKARLVANARLPDAVSAWAMRIGASEGVTLTVDSATGLLTGPSLVPGRYEISMSAVGYGTIPLGIVRVERDATLDLGDIRLAAPGRLLVKVGSSLPWLKAGGSIQAVSERGTVWARPAADGTATFDLLQPGTWHVVVPGWPFSEPVHAAQSRRVEITSGTTAAVEVEAVRGHVRQVRAVGIEQSALLGFAVDVHEEGSSVALAQGRFAHESEGDHPLFQVALAPGRYVADAETAEGRRISVPFELRGDGEPPVDLDFRR